jgi:hypothetical protein
MIDIPKINNSEDHKESYTIIHGNVNRRKRQKYDRIQIVKPPFDRHSITAVYAATCPRKYIRLDINAITWVCLNKHEILAKKDLKNIKSE